MSEREEYELLSVRDVLARYRLTDLEPHVPQLNPAHVPASVRHLTPHAQIWGVADDTLRMTMIERAAPAALAELKQMIIDVDDMLDAWLAGPEADDPHPSDEYVAFSAMRMVTDAIR
jgi:hypothetical protein